MKTLEVFGTLLAALGFSLLSFNMLFHGFFIGLISCFCLIPVLYKNKLFALLGLQLFFMCANINGIFYNF